MVSVGVHWRELERTSRSGPWILPDGSGPFPAHPHWTDPFSRRVLTLGEVACSLSHRRAWERALDGRGDAFLFLEDDARLLPPFGRHLAGTLRDLEYLGGTGEAWGAAYLSQREETSRPLPLVGRFLRREEGHPLWTTGYLLSRAGAEALLSHPAFRDPGLGIPPADDLIPAVFGIHRDSWMNGRYSVPGRELPLSVFSLSHRLLDQERFTDSLTEKAPPVAFPSRITVLSVATDPTHPGVERMLSTASRYGFRVELLGAGSPSWDTAGEGGIRKLELLKAWLEKNGKTEEQERKTGDGEDEDGPPILFVDSHDVVFTRSEGDLLDEFRSLGSPDLLFAAEKLCWPDGAEDYRGRERGKRFPFLNSGGFLGKLPALRELFRKFPISLGEGDDQRFFTRAFLSWRREPFGETEPGPDLRLDHDCRVFQCLSGATGEVRVDRGRGSLFNPGTDSWPVVVHANGPSTDWLEGEGSPVGGRFRTHYGEMAPPEENQGDSAEGSQSGKSGAGLTSRVPREEVVI